MSAVKNWLRTVEIFTGYLRHMKRVENSTDPGRTKDAFAEALERANTPARPEALRMEDQLRHELLRIAQCKRPFSLGGARRTSSARLNSATTRISRRASKKATESLKTMGLLVQSTAPEADHATSKSICQWVEVAKWTSLSQEAQEEATRLRINRDNFL